MRTFLVQGMAYGDESKGATVDKLCRSFPVETIIRFGGGAQCAHNVVTPDGVHHCFSQFGSGMLANDRVETYLSRYVLVDPIAMLHEAEALETKTANVWSRIAVSQDCLVVTKYHKILNRLREMVRGEDRHGSCGMGIGVAREMELKYGRDAVLLVKECGNRGKVLRKLVSMYDAMAYEIHVCDTLLGGEPQQVESYEEFSKEAEKIVFWASHVRAEYDWERRFSGDVLFEGHQGVLLDEKLGEPPYNTWTDTTFAHAEALSRMIGRTESNIKIGCFRSYFTRHGAGPFPTGLVHVPANLTEPHNPCNEWQGEFRVGRFDFEAAKRAVQAIGGVDYLAISHLDQIDNSKEISIGLRTPVGMWGYGPTANDRWISPELGGR